jgi:Beta-galactosidase
VWRRESITLFGGAATMSFSLKVVVGILLLVGYSVSASEPKVNGFPTNPDFFPIGIWLQSPSRAANYKAIGINTFVGLHEGPTEKQLAELAQHDMFAVARQNDIGLKSLNRHVIKAWMQDDEPDNAQPLLLGLHGTCIPAKEVVRRTQKIKTRDPTRPVMINFGQGVVNEFWRGRGRCNGDQSYYDLAIQGADIVSYDIYPVASRTPQVKGKLEYVARGVTNLVKRAADGQSVWMVLETTALDPARRPIPAQVRAEVWMALIHGATGIVYFVHEFQPTFREDAIFRYPDIVEEITKTNQMIKSLAPVLKGPSIHGAVSVSSTTPIATMVKGFENTTYVFAVAMQDSPTRVRITVRDRQDARVRVLGEDRSVIITQGAFEDQFEGYGVHLYQIP